MGKLRNFVIEFCDELGVYNAGQTVFGNVFVELDEPMTVRGIRIALLGRGKVHWSVSKGKNDRRHYRAEEIYMNERLYLIGAATNEGDIQVPAGSHRYPFSIALNNLLPSSFEGKHGYVRYTIQATIDRPWKFDHDTRTAFTVNSILDLNIQNHQLAEPYIANNEKIFDCCCCFEGGPVTTSLQLNRRCFVPGETILVSAEIVNNCGTEITSISASLEQITEFLGVSDSFFSSGNQKSKIVTYTIEKYKRQDVVPSGTSASYSASIFVPSLPPSTLVGCSIINVNYKLKLHVSATCNDLEVEEDIIIGTVPLREVLYHQQPAQHVVTVQPSAPQPPEYSVAGDFEMPPPSYEECVGGQVNIKEEGDSEFLQGSMTFAPRYPMYRQLSFPSGNPP